MAGGPSTKKKKTTKVSDESTMNPETLERTRLKTLAFSNKILSQTPAKPYSPLAPSKFVAKHHGRDIVKKSQRKNRFLFSFPGLLAPISGGKIGELKDLGSKNPILYLDFPQGRMKLFGTIVYPKNRYLTLQFPRGGKNVMCEDYFDNMLVFSEAWWIGRQDENPEESRLDFPKELSDGKQADYDFKGGAGGAACSNKQAGLNKEVTDERVRSPSPMTEDDFSGDENKDSVKVTPVRQSARTAGKKFRFAEASPEDDSISIDADESEEEEKTTTIKKENVSVVFNIDDEDPTLDQERQSNKKTLSSITMNKSVEDSKSNRGSLVQTTIATLFKKVEEKKTLTNSTKGLSPKASSKKTKQNDSKQMSIQDGASAKKGKKVNEKLTGGKGKGKKRACESDDDDDIEEFSSESQIQESNDDESDEDWEA